MFVKLETPHGKKTNPEDFVIEKPPTFKPLMLNGVNVNVFETVVVPSVKVIDNEPDVRYDIVSV